MFWVGVINLVSAAINFSSTGPASTVGWIVLAMAILCFWMVYFFQSPPTPHSEMLERLGTVQTSLKEVDQFISREMTRLKEAQQTVDELTATKDRLRPVVDADKETVDAVLSAYTDSSRRSVWKDRAVGFVLGVVASMVASLILAYVDFNIVFGSDTPDEATSTDLHEAAEAGADESAKEVDENP